jgi:uncharacterized protein
LLASHAEGPGRLVGAFSRVTSGTWDEPGSIQTVAVSVVTDVEGGTAWATVDGQQAGRLGFRIRDTEGSPEWTLYTTVVHPAFEGHGVGSALVEAVIKEADAASAQVYPTCWFVAGWLDRHPEYQRLRPDDLR